MLRLCSNCSNDLKIQNVIDEVFVPVLIPESSDPESGTDELDFQPTILLKEWISTDRTELVTRICTIDEFLIELKDRLIELIPHAYVAKQQSTFLEDKKKSLHEGTAIVLADLSENYDFVVQDEVYGFYWNISA